MERPRGRPFPPEKGYVGAFYEGPPHVSEEKARILLESPDKVYAEIKNKREALLEKATGSEEQSPTPEVENNTPTSHEEQPPHS